MTDDAMGIPAIPGATPRIVGKDVTFAYGDKPVLDGVHFCIEPGAFVGLLGPNGCGKTTLLGAISGTHRLQRGKVLLGERNVASYTPREIARFLTVVPQFSTVSFAFTALEVVLMGRHPFKERFERFTQDDLEICLHSMGLTDTLPFAKKPVTQLSGGERQRVILARALAQQPRVLLLDEATSNLDIRHTVKFMAAVRDLSQRSGVTVAAVMHDLNLAAMFCDEAILLHERTIQAAGPIETVLTRANIEHVYGTPVHVSRSPDGRLAVHLRMREHQSGPESED